MILMPLSLFLVTKYDHARSYPLNPWTNTFLTLYEWKLRNNSWSVWYFKKNRKKWNQTVYFYERQEIDLDRKKWLAYLAVKVDLDLGNYERFLDIKLTRDNNITTGKIYQASGLNFMFLCVLHIFLAGKNKDH